MGNDYSFSSNTKTNICRSCITDKRTSRHREAIVHDHHSRESTFTTPTDDGESIHTDCTNIESQLSEITEEERTITYDGWRKAVEAGNESLAAFLIEEYPLDLLEYHWDNCDSALHVAVKNNRARMVFFLLTAGASVNEQNRNTLDTALHIAVRNRRGKIIDLLLKWGADVNITNVNKETPITISALHVDKDIFKMLVPSTDNSAFTQRLVSNTQRFSALKKTMSLAQMPQSILEEQYSEDAKYVLGMNEEEQEYTQHCTEFGAFDEEEYGEFMDKVIKNTAKKQHSDVELQANQIAARNPFTNIGRRSTRKRLIVIEKNLSQENILVPLEGWLEKRKPGLVQLYQRRWIIVKGAHMLWSGKQIHIDNDADSEQRKRFNGYIHLMTVDTISKIQTKSNNKFMVKAKDVKQGNVVREYIFRCLSTENRDYWVDGLKEHKKQYQTVLTYLGR